VAAAGPSTTPEDLMRAADIALYDTKRWRRGRFTVFDDQMRVAAAERIAVKADLEKALGEGQFRVVYQPIVDLQSGELASCEALLRWDHPVRGAVSPVDFIPLAEESGQIRAIGRWVLEQACREAAGWSRPGPPVRVSVNVSAVQLQGDELVDQVADALATSGLEPDRLTLEVTETAIMVDPAATGSILDRLRGLGARIAIDDFGTGYCSLGYLERFAVHSLKIDRMFVAQILTSATAPLAASILRLAESLDIPVVAEGIEDEAELDYLRDQGCAYGQGFYIARPLPPEEFRSFMLRSPAGHAQGA